jgi:hypothetical protein
MRHIARLPHLAQALWWCLVLALLAPAVAWTQSAPPEGEFVYIARPGDTLIGVSQRLLIDPRRWNEVQARNNIADPRRIPLGTQIRIPYSWLRLSAEVATVTATSGDVRNETRNINTGDTLAEGSQIYTGPDGSVTLSLADGSVITLQKSSVLTLEGMRGVTGLPEAHDTRIKLQSGRLQTIVKPQGNVGRFEIRTPVAVSAVRGTQFRSTFEPGTERATTETLEGLVAVSAATAVVSLPANFGTRVERDAPPLPPTPLLPPPDLQAIPETSNASRLQLEWPAVGGAAAYRVQLSPDAEFKSFIVDTESAAPAVDVPAPIDGNYWLRVRSIDNLGLEGQDAVRTLVQRLLPAPPALAGPLPDANVVGNGATFAWTSVVPEARYRLQIARDASFTDLLVERDAGEAAQVDIEQVPPGRYFWRVAGVNAQGERGAWTAAQAFTQRRPSPTPHEPTFVSRQMQMKWQPEDGTRYRVQIARDPEFRTPLIDQTLDEAGMSIHRPRPGIYYARIQTLAADGGTAPFGEPRQFEVPLPRWLQILLPVAAILAGLA